MRQLLQNLRTGRLELAEVPVPCVEGNRVLVRTEASLISTGTERALAELARKGLLGKARARPDLVQKVLTKLRRDGFWATLRAVTQQLDRWVPLGYSASGRIVAVGPEVRTFRVGTRVACAGAGIANHAEYNSVPELLAATVPEDVPAEDAAYATVGAIAIHAIRNAQVQLCENVAVIGLGLLGQLSVQILRAAGCRVVGLDPVAERRDLAASCGVNFVVPPNEACVAAIRRWSGGLGVDAVLITAATTSNAPIELAAAIARDRARVVMVGVTGMQIPRKAYYEKELTFLISRSYGPGRYDLSYEEHGHDYPPGYVRWTEQRNLQAFLELVAQGAVRPRVLTTHRFPIDRAEEAFELILSGRESYLGVVITYPQNDPPIVRRIDLPTIVRRVDRSTIGISFIGAGHFAQGVLLPVVKKHREVRLRGIISASGVTARSVGRKFGFAFCGSDLQEVLDDRETDVVFIVTRHSQHAPMVCHALKAGKAVFCEKPLAINYEQLEEVRRTLEETRGQLLVGFNRRFAPLAEELKNVVRGRGPLCVTYRVNAGPIPTDHWLADPAEGGRIIGEACHFFDFFMYLTESEPTELECLTPSGTTSADDGQFLVRFQDGSVCHLMYTTAGSAGFSKERIEVHTGGLSAVLSDFRHLQLDDGRKCKSRTLWMADKGHKRMIQKFLASLLHPCGEVPIPLHQLISVSQLTLTAARASLG